MSYPVHFVGSRPRTLPADDRDALLWFLKASRGLDTTSLPAWQEPDWVVPFLARLAELDDVFEIVDEPVPAEGGRLAGVVGDPLPGYDAGYRFRAYRVRRGVRLLPEHVAFGDVGRVDAQVAELERLREETATLGFTPLLVSVPSPIDLALFTFVGSTFPRVVPSFAQLMRAMRALPVYTEATVQFVNELAARHAWRVLIQLEAPSALVGMWKGRVAPGGSTVAANWHATETARMAARFHANVNWMLHLCYGDYNHREVFQPDDLGYTVTYLNTLARQLDRYAPGRAWPTVHVPCTFGAQRAITDDWFYAPLLHLNGRWTDLIAGVVSEEGSTPRVDSIKALRLFEQAAGREARAVACACGFGRRDESAALHAADLMADVAEQGVTP